MHRPSDRTSASWGAVFGLGIVVAMLDPLLSNEDSFPLSNYPMFSHARPTRAEIFHVVGVSSEGRHRPLPPELLGTDEIMQAFQTTRQAIRRGRASALALCERVAQAVVVEGEAFDDIVEVDVRTDLFDTLAYWQGERRPLRSSSVATCAVTREAP
jgi:hypothetical protein